MMSSLAFPLLLFGQSFLTALVATTTRKSSLLRPALFPVLLALSYQAFHALDYLNNDILNSCLAGLSFGNALHCLHVLCVLQIDVLDVEREMKRQGKQRKDYIGCLYWMFMTMLSARGINTTYQIKNVPDSPFNNVPSRPRFLIRQLAIILFQYCSIDLVTSQPPPKGEVRRIFGPGKERLFFRPAGLPVTTEDMIFRAVVSLMAWVIMGRMVIDIAYRVLSVVFVGLAITEPQEWPPLFGSIRDAYTLRGYWGKFWHQLLRWPYQGLSSYICRDLLRLPKPSRFERYLNIFLVFALSATMHLVMDMKCGLKASESGAFHCFLLHACGIMLEDAVQELFRRAKLAMGYEDKEGRSTSGWRKALGFLWVGTFLIIVAPLYNYPLNRKLDFERSRVPYSLVGNFLM